MSFLKYILLAVAYSVLLYGLTTKWFPYIFPVVIAIAILYVCILFKSLYDEFLIYRYYTANGEAHRAELAVDPIRFHMSIIYLMADMLRTDSDTFVHSDKLKVIIRYIHEACPEEYREMAVEALDYLTCRHEERSFNSYSVLQKDNIIRKTGKNYLTSLSGGKYYHNISGWRMAEELGHYLSETDRMYVMYLLFSMAIADNSVSIEEKKDHRSEMVALQQLCVKGLKVPFETLKFLFDEWQAGRLKQWYEDNIACKGRYPAYDVFADIVGYTENKANDIELEKVSVPTSKIENVIDLLILNFVVQIILYVVLAFQTDDVALDCFNKIGKKFVIFSAFTLLVMTIVLYFSKKGQHSYVLYTLRTHKETSLQRRSIIGNTIVSIVYSLTLWFGVTMLSYVCFNNNYTKGEIKKTVDVKDASVHDSSKSGGSYWADFAPSELSPSDLKDCEVPQLTPLEKIEAKILPKITFVKLLVHSKELISSVRISPDLYEKLSSNAGCCKAECSLTIGFYELPLEDDIIFVVGQKKSEASEHPETPTEEEKPAESDVAGPVGGPK